MAVASPERPTVRAQVRYVRISPYKVREVLNLIRGEQVGVADDVLAFTERGSAPVVRKALKSAVANAENNSGLAADDLFVAACFADEGPTLKRWRPRARGRATRIRKRTCHITIELSVLSPEQLARLRGESAGAGRRGSAAAAGDSRRRRVAKSKGEDATVEEAADEAADESGDEPKAEASKKAPAKKATKKATKKTTAKKTASESEKAVKEAASKKAAAKKAVAKNAGEKATAKKAPAKKASKTTKKAATESDSGDADKKDS
jgi:large subunit ribosomal protein L22